MLSQLTIYVLNVMHQERCINNYSPTSKRGRILTLIICMLCASVVDGTLSWAILSNDTMPIFFKLVLGLATVAFDYLIINAAIRLYANFR